MTNNNKGFKALNVSINYNRAMLRDEKSVDHVANVITWLVRTAELKAANDMVKDLQEKRGQALTDDENADLTGIFTKEERELWDDYLIYKALLEKIIAKTGYDVKQWNIENATDKIFYNLIALPNMPRKFAKTELIEWSDLIKYMDIAEKYFNSTTAKVDPMKNQLEHDFNTLRRGGDIFRGVRVRPSGMDTKKFLALFIKDLKIGNDGNYDFVTLYSDKKKTEAVRIQLNKFMALYIVNRMDAVAPLTKEEEEEEAKKNAKAMPEEKKMPKLSKKTVERIKKTRQKKTTEEKTPESSEATVDNK